VGDDDELTIGIDARAASEATVGRARVVQELLRALAARDDPHRYVLYSRERWEVQLDARFRWRLIDHGDPWWHLMAARGANRECDAFLSSNSYLTIWFLSIPGVPIVYDLVAFDRSVHPPWRSAMIERLTMGGAVRRSAAFIAISQATADELASRFPNVEGRVTVAPLAAASTATGSSDGAEGAELPPPGFVLAVGTLEPRKNLPRLADAYAQLPAELQRRHPLVVVGKIGWQVSETLDALRALGERCLMLGHVSDAELAELYRRCAVFCYPSLAEGFGLPVLEAMTCGAAVLTSNCSSLPEVGGDAVEYVDPRDTQDMATGLARLLEDPARRSELGARARTRAAGFSWAVMAETTLRALTSAAQRRVEAQGHRRRREPRASV
jgi:glycosyltransferase involved in cell wall biosynthesis